jgi:hypothetical protein
MFCRAPLKYCSDVLSGDAQLGPALDAGILAAPRHGDRQPASRQVLGGRDLRAHRRGTGLAHLGQTARITEKAGPPWGRQEVSVTPMSNGPPDHEHRAHLVHGTGPSAWEPDETHKMFVTAQPPKEVPSSSA